GYFSAAQGILIIGLLGVIVPDALQRLNATKIVLSLVVNLVAAITYTIVGFDRIDWAAAGLIAVGSLIGGVLGSSIGRRLSPVVLRACIVVLGVIAIYNLVQM
ncbi:MAG: TSUP family transporter, partial [Nocardioidaceae bacterium]